MWPTRWHVHWRGIIIVLVTVPVGVAKQSSCHGNDKIGGRSTNQFSACLWILLHSSTSSLKGWRTWAKKSYRLCMPGSMRFRCQDKSGTSVATLVTECWLLKSSIISSPNLLSFTTTPRPIPPSRRWTTGEQSIVCAIEIITILHDSSAWAVRFITAGKVFSKLNFNIPDDILQNAAASKPGVVEFILSTLRMKVSVWYHRWYIMPSWGGMFVVVQIEKYLEDHSQKPTFVSGYDPSSQYYDPSQMVSTYNNPGPEPWSQV